MALYFITSNKRKFDEAKKILGDSIKIKQLDIDLPEVQDIDSKVLIKAKIKEALKHKKGEFVVEDTSLVIKGMNGLPGPFVKWFVKSIGLDGLYELSKTFGQEAEGKAVIGYAKGDNLRFFEGVIKGKIVKPKGKKEFCWDPVFAPEKHTKTFAEMTIEEKSRISHRKKAFEKLKKFLKK